MTLKKTEMHTLLIVKGRIVLRGDLDPIGENEVKTASSVVADGAIKATIAINTFNGRKARTADVVGTFLGVDNPRDVYMTLPRSTPREWLIKAGYNSDHKIYKVKKCLYGLRESGLLFYEALRKTLWEGTWVPSEIDPCLFTDNRADKHTITTHVDDLLIFASD